MPDLEMQIFIGVAAAVLIFVVLIVVIARRKSNPTVTQTHEDNSASTALSGVEYEWESRPAGIGVAMLVAGLVVGLIATIIYFEEGMDVMDVLFKAGFGIFGAAAGILGSLLKKVKYSFTAVGLYKQDLSDKKKKEELLFAWGEVSWIKPMKHGFKYYLIPGRMNVTTKPAKIRTTGYVHAGDKAMLVNSMLMGRGVRTSPPVKMPS
jgi:hypothetical protein